ncbi:MAG TPA: hypothetical protein VMS64_26070 [Candidatus Methylomirabilis sp.]|nr:hypothetical protein [Candidatus Methylomirabilis sp.]
MADFMAPADVTGTWQSLEGIAIRLELEQRGAKFPGQMFVEPSASSAGVEIEGPVSADVFRFSRGGASDFGVMTVNGDDMSGHIPAYSRGEIRLQRVRSSSPKP